MKTFIDLDWDRRKGNVRDHNGRDEAEWRS
jgi:hypothetical protein